jgi:eukaryotic-like serine/threonine-protein kinase
MTQCPTHEQLDGWVNEQLEPLVQAELAAHVDACSKCQAELDRLTAGSPATARPDPEFDDLLRQLRETLPRVAADGDRPMVPGYDLIEVVGRGGMGVVFRAWQRGVNREVAVKLLHRGAADGDEAVRFRREGEALGKLRHPNVVQVFDVGVAEGRPFLVMEFVPGGPLSKHAEGKPIAPGVAAEIVEGIGQGVQHAHEQGILHRDLKPGNILLSGVRAQEPGVSEGSPLTPGSSPITPKIADFGLARRIDAGETLTQAGMIVGTPSYMAPEQVAGNERLTPACDVYGLGAVLYELLTGRPPFSGASPADVLLQARNVDPVPPSRVIPTLPRDLNTVCLKCLAKDPRKRYSSAGAVVEDLRRWRAGEPILARPVGTAEKAWKWARRRKAAAALLGMALFLLLIGLPTVTLLWWWAERERRHAADNFDRTEQSLYAAHIAEAELHYRLNDLTRTRFHLAACEPEAGRPDRRGWEWLYLQGLAYSEHVDLPSPPPPDRLGRALYAVDFSPDGKFVAAGGGVRSYFSYSGREAGELTVWDRTSERPIPERSGPEPLAVTALRYGADGRLFTVEVDVWHRKTPLQRPVSPAANVWPGAPGVLRARAAQTRAIVFERPLQPPYLDDGIGHPEIPALAVSPDGTRVVVGTAGSITAFDARSGEPVFDHPGGFCAGFDESATTLLVAEAGPHLAGAPRSTWLTSLDARTGQQLGRREIGPAESYVRAFGPSGRYFARLTTAGDVVLIPTGPGRQELRVRLGLPKDQVSVLALSPDDELLATGGPDGAVRVWEVRTNRARQVFRGHTNRVLGVAFDSTGRQLVSVGWDRTAKVWDLRHTPEFTNVGIAGGEARAEDCVFVNGGRSLLVARAPGGDLEEWDTVTGSLRPLGRLEVTANKVNVPFPGRTVAFSADGKRVAAVSGLDRRQLKVWATDPFGAPVVLDGCRVAAQFLAMSHSGHRLAVAASDRREPGRADLVVWDVDAHSVLKHEMLDGEVCAALAMSPDGKWLAAATRPEGADENTPARLRVWDLAAGRELPPRDPGAMVTALAFDGPSWRLAVATSEPRIRIWDTGSWREARSIPCLEPYAYLAFAPDGRRLAGATIELLTLWDPAAGEEMLTLRGKPRVGSELPFNPRVVFDATGAKLAAAQNDFTVHIWTATAQRGR